MLKHRLTGAAILIGFAVIVLPMLLGGPETVNNAPQGGAMRAESDTKVFRSNITPIGGETPDLESRAAPDAATTDGGEAPQSDVAAAGEESEGSGQDDQQVATRTESDNGAQGATNGSQAIERGWIVQIGTFKNPENVKKLVARLENNGFGSSTSEVETSEGIATRVWVGPFQTRVEAARTKTRVKQRTGSEGLIVAYP